MRSALTFLQELFGREPGAGAQLAADAAYPLADRTFITAACAALTQELVILLPQIYQDNPFLLTRSLMLVARQYGQPLAERVHAELARRRSRK